MIAGVCGGLGQALRIDSSLVRLFFVLLAFGNGIGGMLYLLLWILVPEGEGGQIEVLDAEPRERRTFWIVGVALIVFGTISLLDNLNIPGLGWLDFDVLWPLLLVAGGLALLLRRGSEEDL
jgi:phage shock protein C